MYDAWILALQKGIGAALQRVNSDSIEMDVKSHSSLALVPSNGNLKHEHRESGDRGNKKVKKVRWDYRFIFF